MKGLRFLSRVIFTGIVMFGVYFFTGFILDNMFRGLEARIGITITLVATILIGIIFFILYPYFLKTLKKLVGEIVTRADNISVRELIGGLVGLILGLFIANLIGNPLNNLSYGPYVTIVLSIFLGYIGFWVGYGKKEEVGKFLTRNRNPREKGKKEHGKASSAVLDTSAIIDGRIADIYRTGFIESQLILPNFVLDELKRVADSSDPIKKSRGRRGMDILNELQKEFPQAIVMTSKDYEEIKEVDVKIIRLAVDMKARIYTNDYNLNKMAQVQNVMVMNVNDLANAVKTVVLPGEEMITRVIKEGKELDQGIAYLEDGTMIVVEGGSAYVGVTLTITVTSVLQTAAGRMIFAKPK